MEIRFKNNNLEFLKELSITEFRLKDQSTLLGAIWSLIHPIVLITVLYFVFSHRFGSRIEHFVLYLLIGVVQYNHFSSSTISAMKSLKRKGNLTENAVFPKEIIVLSSIFAELPEFIISLLMCIIIAIYSGIPFSIYFIISLPIIVILQVSFITWVSLLIAPLYLVLNDIEHLYQIFIRILFFVTPIFYDMSFIENPIVKSIILINPLTQLISYTREIIIYDSYIVSYSFGLYICLNFLMLLISYLIFKKLEPRFGEVV